MQTKAVSEYKINVGAQMKRKKKKRLNVMQIVEMPVIMQMDEMPVTLRTLSKLTE